MSEDSKIEWTDHTFNPWIGCTKVSTGCALCYADRQDAFRHWTPEGWGKGKPRKRTSVSYWKRPLTWNSVHGFRGSDARQRVFCASLADWLDDEVPIGWLADLLQLIRATPNLDWLLLTKRPENFDDRVEESYVGTNQPYEHKDWCYSWRQGKPPRNVWFGVSAENQEMWYLRVTAALDVPAFVRFVSAEPLLGQIETSCLESQLGVAGIHWVIAGCESNGIYAGRNSDGYTEHARLLQSQCERDCVPFFHKQMPVGRLVSHDQSQWPEDLRVRQFPKFDIALV